MLCTRWVSRLVQTSVENGHPKGMRAPAFVQKSPRMVPLSASNGFVAPSICHRHAGTHGRPATSEHATLHRKIAGGFPVHRGSFSFARPVRTANIIQKKPRTQLNKKRGSMKSCREGDKICCSKRHSALDKHNDGVTFRPPAMTLLPSQTMATMGPEHI